MKLIVPFLLFLLFQFSSFAQDVIIKKDGTKIEAKVLEISSTTVKYTNFTQPEGPTRILQTYEISEIIYEDGQFEKFDVKPPVNGTVTTRPTPAPRKEVAPKDPYFSNGFFFEGLIGISQVKRENFYGYYEYDQWGNPIYTPQTTSLNNLALSLRFGNKWYFGQREKWRQGVQMTWMRMGIHIDPENAESIIIGPKTFTFCNVGITNVFKFNENVGLEANISGGLNLDIDIEYGNASIGLAFGPEVKLRLKKLAIGLDYMHIEGLSDTQFTPNRWNILSLSVGGKF